MAEDGNYFNQPPRPRRRKREPWPTRPLPDVVPVQHINGQDGDAIGVMPPEFTDDAIALRFTAQYHRALRYVGDWGRWMIWDGKVWKRDSTLRVFDLARRTLRGIGPEAPDPKIKMALAGAATVVRVEKLVRSDRRHAVTADHWDGDPLLLNTPGGIVNLETGQLGPHDPNRLMTKCTAVAPSTESDCSQWRIFLARVTGDDPELESYLQRIAGYWLTGLTREHAMWFLYGTGRNGKGVFLNTISRILGDYAMTASPDTFTAEGRNKHLTVLARLQGARLVVSQETEEGVPWAEARIKAVTAGDPITANFMRQDPFTYTPQFKLAVAGNHKPGLKSVDAAIRARLNLTPFTVTIPPTERDPGLSEKLWAEAPAILAWMIEGCAMWRDIRLSAPACVSKATDEYFDSEDATALWIADCCETGKDEDGNEYKDLSGALFKSWSAWALRSGERPGTHKAFSRVMEKHGFPSGKHTKTGTPIRGIRLIVGQPELPT